MNDFLENIIDFIDGNLSEKDADNLQHELKNNSSLNKDFILFKELNSHMKYKLLTESFENDANYFVIEQHAKEDVAKFIIDGKNDKEVLDYLSLAFPEKNISLINEVKRIENEIKEFELDDVATSWIDEIGIDEDKELSDFISPRIDLTHEEHSIKKKDYKNKFQINKRKIYLFVTSAAAIILIALMLKNSFLTLNNEEIFSNLHNKPQELYSIVIRGNNSEVVVAFNSASDLYEQKKYEQAYDLFNKIALDNPKCTQAIYYSGLAKFEAGDYKKSIKIFNNIISNYDVFNVEAKWFLALSYIKLNDYKNAVPYLNDLTKQKSIYQNKAKKILEIIN